MKKYVVYLTGFLILAGFFAFLPKKNIINALPSTSAKDTLSSSQLSYFARIGTGVSLGDSIIKIDVTANPSKTTNNLFEGDVVCIGSTHALNGCTQYTIKDIGNTGYFEINIGISGHNAIATAPIFATRSAQHVVTFTPQSNIISGKWQFLLKATSTAGEKEADGIPDQNGFDLGAAPGTAGPGTPLVAADIACPWGTASIGATVSVLASNGTSYGYHNILCTLAAGGTNPIGTASTWTIGGSTPATQTMITNPSPNHTVAQEGNADVYNFFIRHQDSTGLVIDGDTTRGQIAVVESVRVTATVDPTISFIIDNTGVLTVGTSVCLGSTLGPTATQVTATQVPFGSLRLLAFNDLAQRLSATTNAAYGYVVTVKEEAPLTVINGSVTIPDTTCDGGGGCTAGGAGDVWVTASSTPSKFGYTLTATPSEGATPAFTTGATRLYRPFSTTAQTIFSKASTPTGWERVYICYRISITTTQMAANYENKLIYTATATF